MCQVLDLKWKSKMHMKAVISLRHTVKLIPAERDLSAQRQRFFPVSDLIEICQIILPHKPQCSGWLSGTYMLHAVDVSRSRRGGFFFLSFLCSSCTFFSFALSDSADVESLSQDSSDEENEEREEEEPKAEVTSMDEALRTVTGAADHGQEDFLKQNFETLAESCSMGRRDQTLTCNFKGILFGEKTLSCEL